MGIKMRTTVIIIRRILRKIKKKKNHINARIAQSLRDIQICFLQEESIMKRNRTNVRNAGRYFLAKEEHKESVVAI